MPRCTDGARERCESFPYSHFKLNEIEKIASTLHRFRQTDSPELQVLIRAVLNVIHAGVHDGSYLHWEIFLKTGLHKVVVDILCDDRTYAPTKQKNHPAGTFVLLRRFAEYLLDQLNNSKKDPKILAWVDEVLALLPRLWEYTWTNDILKHHIPLRTRNHDWRSESEDLSATFIHTIYTMNTLYTTRNDRDPPITNYISHMLLWIWVNSDEGGSNKTILEALVFIVDDAKDEELRSFLQEAVVNKGLTPLLAKRFRVELLYEYNIDAELSQIIVFLNAISVNCLSVLCITTEESPYTLLQCIRIACQRQICLSVSDEGTNDVLGISMRVIRDIMRDYTGPANRHNTAALSEIVDTVKFIPMAARVTFHAINKSNGSVIQGIQTILETYGMAGETIREVKLERVMGKTFKVSRDLWYPTIEAIRAHPIPVNDQLKQRARDWALQIWLKFGEQLGFQERVEKRRIRASAERGGTAGAGPLPIMPGARTCGWKKCLCSWDKKPPHHMRVCKGCWRTWYCGPNCQTRDWRYGGHREYCQSHQL